MVDLITNTAVTLITVLIGYALGYTSSKNDTNQSN